MLKWECQLFHSPHYAASRCGCLPGMAQHLPHIFAGYSEPVGSTGNASSCSDIPVLISSQSSRVPAARHRALQAWLERNYSTWLCSSSATTGLPQLRQQTSHAGLWFCVVLFDFWVCNKMNLNKRASCIKIILVFISVERPSCYWRLSQHLSWAAKNAMPPCLWNYFFKVITYL